MLPVIGGQPTPLLRRGLHRQFGISSGRHLILDRGHVGLNNAYDAIADLPDKWIQVRCKEVGDYFHISIIDSGKGIPSSVKEQIIRPFFTTKEVGKGTGLGGSISYGIVNSFGGSIRAENSHQGLCVTMSFPAAEAPVSGALPPSDIANAV